MKKQKKKNEKKNQPLNEKNKYEKRKLENPFYNDLKKLKIEIFKQILLFPNILQNLIQ